jgi:bacterioferritin-associated ferredoxin
MPVERAMTAYKKERMNCAQSVLRAFQEHRSISEDEIVQARHHGGGRAENGVCGALHAAIKLTDDPSVRDHLRSTFVARAGAETCREIRRAARLPCVECVRLAASLLVEHGGAVPVTTPRNVSRGPQTC